MTVIMFKPRFAPLVAEGTKLQTVRPPRKRPIHAGDILSLRKWSGRPYCSPQVVLRSAVCIEVSPIWICSSGILVGDTGILAEGLDRFAVADGFRSWRDMVAWFIDEHGLPFTGILIRWRA